MIGGYHSPMLRVDAQATQSGAVMGWAPFMHALCQLLSVHCEW